MLFTKARYDAVVIGSGPNGLACAATLAENGLSTAIVEGSDTPGGGTRTFELTAPGFRHDLCSAVHPLAVASPYLARLPLAEHGLRWIFSPFAVAHPFDDGSCVTVSRSVAETARRLGDRDERAYRRLFEPLAADADRLMTEILAPIAHTPEHFGALARFARSAVLPATKLARTHFHEPKVRALFMGMAAHSPAPLASFASAAAGLTLQIAAHSHGWPLPEGGAQNLSQSMISYFRSLGGELVTGFMVADLGDLPSAELVFFDLTPRQILALKNHGVGERVARQLSNFRYGPGVYKMDWVLDRPIPWLNPACAQAATVHVGGAAEEILAYEASVHVQRGTPPPRPFVLLSQPTLFDGTRCPPGFHIAWAYCHVHHGANRPMADEIESQIERFAPGFKGTIRHRRSSCAAELEIYNPNLIGGDICGGDVGVKQMFFRPRPALNPYRLDREGRRWICSSSSPPGPGVHGMCGYHAARAALRDKGVSAS